MALGYKSRRRWALAVLVIGLPLYVVLAVTLANWGERVFGRLPFWAEIIVYVGLGFLWIVPFRGLFRGVGRPAPDLPSQKNPEQP